MAQVLDKQNIASEYKISDQPWGLEVNEERWMKINEEKWMEVNKERGN